MCACVTFQGLHSVWDLTLICAVRTAKARFAKACSLKVLHSLIPTFALALASRWLSVFNLKPFVWSSVRIKLTQTESKSQVLNWVFYLANLNWMLELKWFISSRKLIVGRDYAVHHQNRLTCQRMQFETKWAAEFKESTGSNSSHGTFGVSTVLVSYWLQSTVPLLSSWTFPATVTIALMLQDTIGGCIMTRESHYRQIQNKRNGRVGWNKQWGTWRELSKDRNIFKLDEVANEVIWWC